MSLIPVQLAESGNDCLANWPADGTPSFVYASFSGIQKGNLWGAADPPPPNNRYKLNQLPPGSNCLFSRTSGQFLIEWASVVVPLDEFQITFAGEFVPFFQFTVVAPPVWSALNTKVNPVGEHYYGGRCQINVTAPALSPSLLDTADDIHIPTDGTSRADFWPVGDAYTEFHYSRVVPTKLLIRKNN